MTSSRYILYYDRRVGALSREKVFASAFLQWSYNSASGRFLTRLVLSRRCVSSLVGRLCRSKWSRRLIGPFMSIAGVENADLPAEPQAFRSFSEFFVRPMAEGRRPIATGEGLCVAPVDGKVLVFTDLLATEPIRIKRCTFTLDSFLKFTEWSRLYDGGTMLVFRLCLADYHRFHFPVDGTPHSTGALGRRYFAGGQYARRWDVPFFRQNVRAVTTVKSPVFGDVAMVEVGAFTVGSIVQTYLPGRPVSRGDLKGWFAPGGSTVVLLFQRGRIVVNSDLIEQSARDIETRVYCAEEIGHATMQGGT